MTQSQIRISLETQAKVFIQIEIEAGKIELASSYMLISVVIREKFNYTEWRKNLFGDTTVQDINLVAVNYIKKNPFIPKKFQINI